MPGPGQQGAFIAPHRAEARGGPGRLDLADDPPHFFITGREQRPGIKRRIACQQLVEQNPQRVNIGAGVDIEPARRRLFRAHVHGRPDELIVAREERLVRQFPQSRLGDAEVDHLHHCLVAVHRHHDI